MERRAIQNEMLMLSKEQDKLNFAEIEESNDGPISWSELKSKMEAALTVGDSKDFVGLLGGNGERERNEPRCAGNRVWREKRSIEH